MTQIQAKTALFSVFESLSELHMVNAEQHHFRWEYFLTGLKV